jgi:hypothetical protein
MNKARVFVRVVELDDARSWELRRGREVLAVVGSCREALEMAKRVASALAPSAVFVHRADGSVARIENFD